MNQFYTVRNGQIATKHIFAGSTRIAAKVRTQDQLGNKTDKVYYYHPDHLGSTNYITNNSGAIHEHTEYFPFGESWASESQNTQANPKLIPYLFTGKELDVETQLYYYGARYYDPRTSVWQSPDPILGQYLGGKPNGGVGNSFNLNLFAYTAQNPVKYSDPTGSSYYNLQLGSSGSNTKYGAYREYGLRIFTDKGERVQGDIFIGTYATHQGMLKIGVRPVEIKDYDRNPETGRAFEGQTQPTEFKQMNFTFGIPYEETQGDGTHNKSTHFISNGNFIIQKCCVNMKL